MEQAQQYLESIFQNIQEMLRVDGQKYYQLSPEVVDNLEIAAPYIIYNLENAQNEIYYFPIVSGKNVVLIISVFKNIDGCWSEIEEYYIETGMVDEADKVGVLGKKQISAKAKSLGDTDTSNSGMFRETLCLMQTKKGDNVYVTYNGTWLKTPQNRGCDIVGIAVDNLTPIKNTIICKYYYALSQYSAAYSNGVREISGSRNLNFDNGATYVITKFNFYTSNAQDNMAAVGNVYNSYKTNRVYIFFRASRKSVRRVSISGNYVFLDDCQYKGKEEEIIDLLEEAK